MNGDELTNMNLEKFADFHFAQKGIATIAVSPMQSPFAVLELSGNDIVEFKEKPLLEDKLVNTGIYVFNHAICELLAHGRLHRENCVPSARRKNGF